VNYHEPVEGPVRTGRLVHLTTTPLAPGYTRTRPGTGSPKGTSTYSALLAQVKENGLLRRRTGFYWSLFGTLIVTFALAWVAFAFLSHEAAHRQVFASQKWNDHAGRWLGTFLVGLSYSWWMNKHTRHHGNPNTVGKDPDIAPDGIRFLPEDAAAVKGPLMTTFMRFQGWLFFPLLTLEGLNLHRYAVQSIVTGNGTKADVKHRWLEAALLVARFGIYLTVVFWFLPFGMACAFLGVQLAVFGVMMGASFAPNHKGMPTIAHDAKVDFFSRQVRTSRNIRGGWWVSFLMGGLNYQVEHHLFPSMPRPALKQARLLVREHCDTLDVPYTETTLLRSYGIVVRYLNRVGLAARDPFNCPMVAQLRIH